VTEVQARLVALFLFMALGAWKLGELIAHGINALQDRWVPYGPCAGCGKWRCPMEGNGLARRRRYAYCPTCMPELYEGKP
jgi:hypothetical protein